MNYNDCLEKVNKVESLESILQLQKEIIQSDLGLYQKGFLLGLLGGKKESQGTVAEEVGDLGRYFEAEDLVEKEKAEQFLDEVKELFQDARPLT